MYTYICAIPKQMQPNTRTSLINCKIRKKCLSSASTITFKHDILAAYAAQSTWCRWYKQVIAFKYPSWDSMLARDTGRQTGRNNIAIHTYEYSFLISSLVSLCLFLKCVFLLPKLLRHFPQMGQRDRPMCMPMWWLRAVLLPYVLEHISQTKRPSQDRPGELYGSTVQNEKARLDNWVSLPRDMYVQRA